MHSSEDSELLKAALRRKLTPDEQARLHAKSAEAPEGQPDWQEELRLNQLLQSLGDAPISSNFTARVLNLAKRELATRTQRPSSSIWWRIAGRFTSRHWAAKAALAAVVLLVGVSSYRVRILSVREEMARSLAMMSQLMPAMARNAEAQTGVAAWPTLDVLVNFEAVRRLNQMPKRAEVDVELLAALQP